MLKPLLAGLALATFLPAVASASGEADQGVDFKYMYFWDRNQVWNHTPTVSFFKKLATAWKLTYDQEVDYVSGASRRLGLRNIGRLADNDLKLDGITGASRREIRHSEQGTLAYAEGGHAASGAFYYSNERDYTSYSPSLSGSLDFNERNTTLGAGAAVFFDDMHPQGGFKGMGGSRTITSLNASLAQILTPLSLGSVTVNLLHSEGYLGHPYNPVITADNNAIDENLPDTKTAWALSGKFIQGFHLGERLGSVRLDARYYRDDWELQSGTADVQWYQHLGEAFWVRLRARGYSQSKAAFAKDSYIGDELNRTPDIRYFAFSSLTVGLKVGSSFPESWGASGWLPDRWDLGYDHGVRDTKGENDGIHPLYHTQLYGKDEYYIQGTLMAGLSFDL